MNYFKGNTSRFGSAIQVLPSDFGEYLNAFFNVIVVVVFFFFCSCFPDQFQLPYGKYYAVLLMSQSRVKVERTVL